MYLAEFLLAILHRILGFTKNVSLLAALELGAGYLGGTVIHQPGMTIEWLEYVDDVFGHYAHAFHIFSVRHPRLKLGQKLAINEEASLAIN